MSRSEVAERAAELRRTRAPYVHALVVLAERPTSAKPGDEALVLADGTIEGFVGGSCAEVTVRAQSLALLDSGESVLLRITPLPEADQPGKITVVNECLSGGTFEVFLEPVMPALVMEIVGDTPVARALSRIGSALGYEVSGFGASDLSSVSAVVVASHGRDEEAALTAALRAEVPYVGLVASRRRGSAVVGGLDVPEEARARVRTPAGLDLGARTPEEVAVSILAEIVQTRPRPAGRRATTPAGEHIHTPAGVAVDPVCGMSVAMVDTSLHYDYRHNDHRHDDDRHDDDRSDNDGQVDPVTRYWFCGSGCLRAFADDPAAYVKA
jgi:xanthine dehydrogenase accessory factor